MGNKQLLQELQRMHEEETVRRESIIAWYRWYSQFPSNRLARMYPERSDVDLIRTIALWMDLTDRGGEPGFPYDYRSALDFGSIQRTATATPSTMGLVGLIAIALGIVVLFFNWKLGVALVIVGSITNYVGYRLGGGATNPTLMKEGSPLYEREGKRVLEWARDHSSD